MRFCLRVVDLRDELRRRELRFSGVKQELVNRLHTRIQAEVNARVAAIPSEGLRPGMPRNYASAMSPQCTRRRPPIRLYSSLPGNLHANPTEIEFSFPYDDGR